MATITEPMALDKTFNTTETTPRSQADVLAGIESAIRQGFGQSAADVSYDNTTSGLTADDVQEAIDELAAEKVDKVEGKGLSSNDFTDEDKAALDNMELDIESTQTVSGNPITLTDCAPINAESLVVELEPKQDLHGQSAPYVGGAGKNKCNESLFNSENSSAQYCKFTNGKIQFKNTAGTSYYPTVVIDGDRLEAGTYTLSTSNVEGIDTSNVLITAYTVSETSYSHLGEDYIFTINDGDNIYVRITTNNTTASGDCSFNVQIESGSQATDYAPYSNICPITGYDECEVDDVGKNVCSTHFNDWTVSQTYLYLKIPHFDNSIYTMSFVDKDTSVDLSDIFMGFTNNYPEGDPTEYRWVILNGVVQDNKTNVSLAHGINCDTIIIYRPTEAVFNKLFQRFYIQVEEGTTATTYEPYHSSNATIQFGQTVYGGRSNFTDGWTDVTYGFITIDETASIEEQTSGDNKRFCITAAVTDVDEYSTDHICEMLEIAAGNNATQCYTEDNKFAVYAAGYIFISHIAEDVTALRALLAETPLKVAYVLNTASTISTPVTPLKLLKGTNNLSTNGTTITLGYQPDNVIGEVKGEIEKCSPNPEFMHFEVNGNVVDAIPIIFDEAIHSYTVSGDNWKDKTFLCVECCDMRYGILQLVLSSDMAFVDSCGKALMLYPYMRSIEQYIKITISLGQSYGYEISYQTTNTSSLLDYLKIRVRLFN